ncbi:S1/P1 nuclease [Polymorphobacter sp. PAMC 29334]|uniref:S1/P1 nuclease n=1 Tax=Polymorphobacter sp. PAMC 29334 TaxID=2862331 RepID=UPI001C775E84|nr:S1/P1 nuclease [Polymorphobacter sp. PAMC 29334]QYE36116.1 S1/P1 nuclease [Polymorphobacter sp. PAMC 29334]
MRILLAAAIALLPTPAFAWGKTGHRVIGAIAERMIGHRARNGVRTILGTESIAEASAWPDFERSNPDAFWQKEAGPFHYVTVPTGKTYAEVGAPPEGDAVTALKRFAATVRDRNAPLADRQLALRFIIHIVGDLHQPLHAGNGTDKGGNDVKVIFQREPTNLHAVWDSGLIDQEQLSYTEMATWLNARITRADRVKWRDPHPLTWIGESAAIRDRIYPEAPKSDAGKPGEPIKLGFDYIYAWTPTRDLRLEQGGVRLAAYLDWVFARHPAQL